MDDNPYTFPKYRPYSLLTPVSFASLVGSGFSGVRVLEGLGHGRVVGLGGVGFRALGCAWVYWV